jgi:hypothetical protein
MTTGVSFNKKMQKWTARARNTHIGTFETEEEAVKAKDYFVEENLDPTPRKTQPFFSITASNSVFTMADFPTTRRMRDANR